MNTSLKLLTLIISSTAVVNLDARTQAPELELTVRVYNIAEAPPALLVFAESDASYIFRRAGIGIVWLDCSSVGDSRCSQPVEAAEVSLRILPHIQGHSPDAVGSATVTAEGAHYAAIAYQQIKDMAVRPDLVGQALSRIVVHEIAHLLGAPHAFEGNMRARWLMSDLAYRRGFSVTFTASQAGGLRQEVRRRIEASQLAAHRPGPYPNPDEFTSDAVGHP